MKDHELRDDENGAQVGRRIDHADGVGAAMDEAGWSGQPWTDEHIAQQAMRSIACDAMIPDGRIQVTVERGWATLTGRVEWHFQRLAAEGAVRQLSGARGVSNLVKVEPLAQVAVRVKIGIDNAMRRASVPDTGPSRSRPVVAG